MAVLLEDSDAQENTINMYTVMNDLSRYSTYLNDEEYVMGTEGILTIFARIIDSFISVFNNVKSSLLKFTKLVKRSELKYFIESNYTNVKLINRTDYTKIATLEVPVPVGMKVNYVEFTKVITNLIESINMVNKTRETLKLVKDIKMGLHAKDKVNIKGPISNLYMLFDKEYSNRIFKELKKIIDLNAKKVEEIKFGDLFKSMKEFTQCIDDVLSLTYIYDHINTTSKIVDDIIREFDDIIEILERNQISIDKKDIKNLNDVAYLCAQMFEQYGSLTVVYNKLEHNLVEVYKVLKSNV
jgi:hypothetical protein